ncbi:MAG TPA: NAD(P)-binding domain-containing protein [Actinocrinis sp.]|nr:NAD(P)-binding domain-containing protein [Actinocrinis sp.]
MKIGTIGAGLMSEALAAQWVKAGHEVLVGGRTPAKAHEIADRIGARPGTLREAAEFGDAVLFAVRREGMELSLKEAGAPEGTLAGKPVIDCGNAVNLADYSRITWDGLSMSEELARLAPGSHVVKAFNMAHFKVWQLTPPAFGGAPFVVPFAGDEAAKPAARTLISALGCDPLDIGDLTQTHHLEAAAIIVIRQLFAGADPHTVFALLGNGSAARR